MHIFLLKCIYIAILDHRQHGEIINIGSQINKFPQTERMANLIQYDFRKLKNWININSEYLLIILSDHGIDQFEIGGYKYTKIYFL